MAETSGLLNRRTGFTGTEGSNPSVSAKILFLVAFKRLSGRFQCVKNLRNQPFLFVAPALMRLLAISVPFLPKSGDSRVIIPMRFLWRADSNLTSR